MDGIRKFTLTNTKSEQWTFTDENFKVFLHNPSGLGFTRTFDVTRYGNKQIINTTTENFPQVQGDILFFDALNADHYEKYDQFCRFVSYEPLTLEYDAPNVGIYYLDCVVSSLTKTETKQDGLMTCPVVFQGLTMWKGQEITVSGSSATVTLVNDGDFPVGFEVTIEGNLTNPYITLEQDEELYGEAKFDDSTAFNSVYIDSKDGEQNVILEQGGSVLPNPLSYQDLSISNGSIYVTFVKLARGTSTLTIGKESGSITSCVIKYRPIYRSI